MAKQGNEIGFCRRDSGYMFIVQTVISCLYLNTKFTVKIESTKATAMKNRIDPFSTSVFSLTP